ncbi:MAG: hypothetical protein KAU62_18295 [Candidatus Heimdallarchaeota archaeon]|nr:hypothetical protein [Candidatus Heimdallarchaeota archaeon]MCG3258065.1 hypothetical protein [Candidatus Heimdallarchaeota archaeon]MCK4613114.1 hypothetical protein [Candidatus Heimdallarchaeota archaeon]
MKNSDANIDLSKLLNDSYISDQFNNLAKEKKKFIEELTDEEKKIYTETISYIFTEEKSDAKVSRSFAEPFQVTWRKIHCQKDFLRTAILPKITKDVLVKGFPTRIGSHPGFDDVFLGVDSKGKFVFGVFELKTNKIGSTSHRLDKGTEASKLIAFNLRKMSTKFVEKLVLDGVDLKKAQRIGNALFNRFRMSATAIGFDFQRKVSSMDIVKLFHNYFDIQLINKILEAAIKQNQLISLIKTCYAFKKEIKNKYVTVVKDKTTDVTNLINLNYKYKKGKKIEIPISGDFFRIDYDLHTKEFKFPQFSSSALGVTTLSFEQKRAYFSLNKLIRKALKKVELSIVDESGELLQTNEIIKRLNSMQSFVYKALIKSRVFDDFQVFHKGTMFFFLETLSSESNEKKISRYLKNYSSYKGIANYHYHQKWIVPSILDLGIFVGNLKEENENSRKFRLFLYKHLLDGSSTDTKDMDIEEIEELITSNSELRDYLIGNFRRDIRLPDGYFWTQAINSTHLKKALVFCNVRDSKPKKMYGCNLYTSYDFQYLLKDLELDSILLQNPITFGINEGRLVADFNTDRNVKIAKVWIEFLSETTDIPKNTLQRLNTHLGPGGGIDLLYPQTNCELLRMLVVILLKFQENWDKLTLYIIQEIKTKQVQWEIETLKKNNPVIFVNKRNQITINGEEAIIRLGTLDGTNWRTTRPLYCLANSSCWFNNIISIFKRAYQEII